MELCQVAPRVDGRVLVYVAGPLSAKDDVRVVVSTLRTVPNHLLEVVSRWHDVSDDELRDPSDLAERTRLNDMNLADIDRADVVVAWTMTGRPCATYAEIGYAAAKGKVVLWIQGPEFAGANLFDAHPMVMVLSRFPSGGDLLGPIWPITSPTDGAIVVYFAIQKLVAQRDNGKVGA